MSQPPPQRKPMPRDFEEMEFTIEKEEWNEYELKDGTVLRGRIILQKVIRNPYSPNDFSFKVSPPIWAVYAPASSRGEPNVKQGERVLGSKYEVDVNKPVEPWNVYRIIKTGQKLKVKLAVTEVSRFVDKFDADGMPVYDVPTGVSIALSKPDVTNTQ